MTDILTGKGMWLWVVHRAGTPAQIANQAVAAGLSHVIIKIADGPLAYNKYKQVNGVDYFAAVDGADEVPAVVSALKAKGIQAWGFQYSYGFLPLKEAQVGVQRAKDLGLDGFVVNAEKEYKVKAVGDKEAHIYCDYLALNLKGIMPIAFSSFRYPSAHRPLPFEIFLDVADLNMPQVYWVGSHNPRYQLQKSVIQYNSLSVVRPIFPTGAAYTQDSWLPTAGEINEFLAAVKEFNLTGANFWEWRDAFIRYPQLGQAITDSATEPAPQTLEQRFNNLEQWEIEHGYIPHNP